MCRRSTNLQQAVLGLAVVSAHNDRAEAREPGPTGKTHAVNSLRPTETQLMRWGQSSFATPIRLSYS